MRGKLKEIKEEMRRRMHHQPIPEQGRWLAQVVRGYFAYHAVPTNSASIGAFRHHVVALWRCSLSRRSQHGRITRQRMKQIADNWLPRPKILPALESRPRFWTSRSLKGIGIEMQRFATQSALTNPVNGYGTHLGGHRPDDDSHA